MKTFRNYISEGKVKTGSKDPAQARSLLQQAKERFTDVQSLPITETNAPFRFEQIYEAIREAIQAHMAQEGYKPYSHEAVIAFASERNLLTERETARLDRYREIRNDITYRGQKTTVEETQEALEFAQTIIKRQKTEF